MTIINWKKFISNNFCDDKLNVLFDMAEQQRINYREYEVLRKWIDEGCKEVKEDDECN